MNAISVEELRLEMAKGEASGQPVNLVDVRNPDEFEQCRIEGSQLIPLPEIPHRHGEIRAERPVYVHCKAGVRSARVIEYLESIGYEDLINVEGGMDAWQALEDSTSAG